MKVQISNWKEKEGYQYIPLEEDVIDVTAEDVDEVLCEGLFEIVYWENVEDVASALYELLNPSGKLIIYSMDLRRIMNAYQQSGISWEDLMKNIFDGEKKALYDYPTLSGILTKTGFSCEHGESKNGFFCCIARK